MSNKDDYKNYLDEDGKLTEACVFKLQNAYYDGAILRVPDRFGVELPAGSGVPSSATFIRTVAEPVAAPAVETVAPGKDAAPVNPPAKLKL